MAHYSHILQATKLIRLSVIHTHNHWPTGGRAFVRQGDSKEVRKLELPARFSTKEHIMTEKKIHGSTKIGLLGLKLSML